jgi:cyanophycinase
MIAGGSDEANLQTGFDLLPGTIIDQHFLARKRQVRLIGAVTKHPLRVGLGIDEGTALCGVAGWK